MNMQHCNLLCLPENYQVSSKYNFFAMLRSVTFWYGTDPDPYLVPTDPGGP